MRPLGSPLSCADDRLATRSLGVLLACGLLLSGCGDDATGTASEGGSPSTATSTVPPASAEASPGTPGSPESVGAVESDEVALLSETAAGGQVSSAAVPLSDDAAVQRFGAQFSSPRLAHRVARVVARTDVPVDRTLYGAVVAIGCDVSPGVVVSSSDAGVEVTGAQVSAPLPECFAPVTSVALVLVSDP